MKYLLIILSFLSLALASGGLFAQERVPFNKLIYGADHKWYKDYKLFTGIAHYGKLSEINIKDGKHNGLSRVWYVNGKLKKEVNYKDGKEDGLKRVWHKNGQLHNEANMKDGNQGDGLSRWWYDNGQLKEEWNCKNDKIKSKKCWDLKGNQIECK